MINKKALGLLSSIVIMSMVGCSNTATKEEEINLEAQRTIEREQFEFEGSWAEDLTRNEARELYEEILPRMEEALRYFGLNTLDTYISTEEVVEEKGLVTNDRYIEVIIEEPDVNRLEGFYFGLKQYGSDSSSGEIELMLTSILDKKAIEEDTFFRFEEKSFSRFSEDFLGNTERDYTELNEQIFDMIMDSKETDEVLTIENNLDGIKETISVTGDILLYKLETKEFEFIEEE